MEEICTVTYTNSSCHDILKIYVGQRNKFAPQIKSYVFTDSMPDFDVSGHTVVLYDNNDPYYLQWIKCLASVSESYIIYQQEDFFLDGNIDLPEIIRCKSFLDKSDYSFVRLLKIMLQGAIHRPELKMKEFPDIELEKFIYDAHISDPNSFAFMMQTTLWKKKDFIALYDHVKSKIWLESREWDAGMREMAIKGSFYYRGSKKEGKFHWDPELWPHICTAVGKGKWSVSHHGERLSRILREYNVDVKKRGTR
jgi:hypothetical protein